MTWFTTHLALEGLIGWMLISEESREKFRKTWPGLFLFLNYMATFPDNDIFFGIHRGLSHSFFFPFLFLVIALILFFIPNEWGKEKVDFRFVSLCFGIIAFFWAFHIILDIDDMIGPVAIFYPIDDRAYDLRVLLKLGTKPWFILPVTVEGLELWIDFQSVTEALSVYFLNWTPEQQQAVFGDFVYVQLSSLILHLSILALWGWIVLRQNLPLPSNWQEPIGAFGTSLVNWFRSWATIFGLGIIFFGIIIGPTLGVQLHDDIETNQWIALTENEFKPVVAIKMDRSFQLFQPNAHHQFQGLGTVEHDSSGMDTALSIVPASVYEQFQSKISKIGNNYFSDERQNASISEFKTEYLDAYQAMEESVVYHYGFVSSSENETTINLVIPEGTVYYIAISIKNWVEEAAWGNLSYYERVKITGELTIGREVNYAIGWVLTFLGSGVLLVPIVINAWLNYSKKKIDKETEEEPTPIKDN